MQQQICTHTCFWIVQIQLQNGTMVTVLPVYHFNNHVDLFGLNASLYLEIISFSLDEVTRTVQRVS